EILKLLDGVQKAHNLGVAYITHDLSTVRYFSERIFVMYAAKIVEKAPVKELIHNPLHPYTQALLDAIADPDPENAHKMREVPPGEPPSLLHPPPGCRFHPRCKHKVGGLCDREVPPEFEPTSGHFVSCWLYK
ncbi:TPA: ABC transporter ATP-binding protein, partial [Candidatus Micrarchaeota archaeon]|nr:ABC transporter ATP-binding protein [Candidatus Micrarchaeota archaeon]